MANGVSTYGVEITADTSGADKFNQATQQMASNAQNASAAVNNLTTQGASYGQKASVWVATQNALNAANSAAATAHTNAAKAVQGQSTATSAASTAAYNFGQVIGTTIRRLAEYAAVYISVRAAIELVKDSLQAAARDQSFATTFRNLTDNAQEAQTQLAELDSFWSRMAIFKKDDIQKAAADLLNFGAATQNVARYTEDLAAGAATVNVSVGDMEHAFQMMLSGRLQGTTREAAALFHALADSLGVTATQARVLFTQADPATKTALLTKAIDDANSAGGRWAAAEKERQQDYAGQIARATTLWENFKEGLGTGIIEELAKATQTWDGDWEKLNLDAKQLGETIIFDIKNAIVAVIKTTADFETQLARIGNAPGNLKKWAISTARSVTGDLPYVGGDQGTPGPANQYLTGLQDMPGSGYDFGKFDASKGVQGYDMIKQASGDASIEVNNFATRTNAAQKATDDFGADLKAAITFWEDYGNAERYSMDQQSRGYNVMQAVNKLIHDSGDPIRMIQSLIRSGALSPDEATRARWLAYEEDTKRTLDVIDEKMRANAASMPEIVGAGLARVAQQWGTWQTQVSKAIADVANALSNDISQGLTDIFDGTKSVSQGFRDMAVSLIKDLENIAIKLVIQIGLLEVINALSGGSGIIGGINIGALIGGSSALPAHAEGGRIPGFGGGDKNLIATEGGEYVVNKDSAKKFGYDRLEKINKMQRGGIVGYEFGGQTGNPNNPWGSPFLLGDPETYGPGSPNATPNDMRQRIGSYLNPLQWGDIALSPLTPGYSSMVDTWVQDGNGNWWHVADGSFLQDSNHPTPAGTWEVYYPATGAGPPIRGSGSAIGTPTGWPFSGEPPAANNRVRSGAVRVTDTPIARHPAVQGSGFIPSNMHQQLSQYLTDEGGPIGGGFANPSFSTTNFVSESLTPGERIVGYSTGTATPGQTEMQNVESIGFNATGSGIYGGSPSATGDFSTWVGGSALGVSSGTGIPTGYDAHGNPVYGGQGGGFNIPGGINWAPGSPGGNLGNWNPFRGAYGGRHPYSQATFNQWIGWQNSQGNALAGARYYPGQVPGPITYGPTAGGSYSSYLNSWNNVQAMSSARFSGLGRSDAMVGNATGLMHIGQQVHQFHTGGVVDSISAYASGGVVSAGEGVFTPDQMRNLGPSSNSNVNLSHVEVNIIMQPGGGATTNVQGPGGLSERDARGMGNAIIAVIQAQIEKNKRVGGSLYNSRAVRGG